MSNIERSVWFLLPGIVLTGAFTPSATAQIWVEDFNTYPDATTDGAPRWTSTATDCDQGGVLNIGPGTGQWGVWNDAFTVNDIEGSPCCAVGGGHNNYWLSEVISLAGFCNIEVALDVGHTGTLECAGGPALFACQGNPVPDNGHDQIVAEYSLDGARFVQFDYACGSPSSGTMSVSGLNGSTIQIRVSAANNSTAETYTFDNITVSGTAATNPSTFAQLGPVCENSAPFVLPITSTEGVTGTWNQAMFNPSGLGGTTQPLTFTPSPGQCALPAAMNIAVQTLRTLTAPALGPVCNNRPPAALPTLVDGIAGSWSGQGVQADSFDPSGLSGSIALTFTPNSGICASPLVLQILVNEGPSSLCPPLDDQDQDGLVDGRECPDLNACPDLDNDGVVDYLDADDDGDLINTIEECPNAAACTDTDGDGTPDYGDVDDDGDTLLTRVEVDDGQSFEMDTDQDGFANWLDTDADQDGSPDNIEGRRLSPTNRPAYLDASFFGAGGLSGGSQCALGTTGHDAPWVFLFTGALILSMRKLRKRQSL